MRFYTRELPTPVARRRVDEIDADLHDHIAHERAHGTSDRRIALSILSRMVRGLAADASWRGHTLNRGESDEQNRSTIGIVLAPAFILLAAPVGDAVHRRAWPGVRFDFALAGALLIGIGLAYQAGSEERGQYRVPRRRRRRARRSAPARLEVNLSLGIIGETGDPADLMYGGVLAVGIIGAVIARFRPEGMARALLATALARRSSR